jgi:hypothetical protein
MQTRWPKLFVPALLAAALPTAAVLAQAGRDSQGDLQNRPARLSADARARLLDGRIAMIKETLKLNPDQLKLWAPVEQQIRDRFAARQRAREEWRQRREQRETMSPADRLDRASKRLAERAQRLQAFAAAFRPFYESLSDEQKAVASLVLRPERGFHDRGFRMHRRFGQAQPDAQQ